MRKENRSGVEKTKDMKHWGIKDVLYSGMNGTGARAEPIFSLKYNEIIGWDV